MTNARAPTYRNATSSATAANSSEFPNPKNLPIRVSESPFVNDPASTKRPVVGKQNNIYQAKTQYVGGG